MKGFFRNVGCLLLTALLAQSVYAAEDKSGVVLSFDDTFIDQWHDYFMSVDNDVKATFFVSHWHTLSAARIQKLRDLAANGHEIGGHSYDHQSVASDYNFDPNRVDEYLNTQIIPTLANMQADGFNPVSFAYPYGARNEVYDAAVRQYFPYIRTTFANDDLELFQIDEIYHDENSTYALLAGDGIDNSYGNPASEIEAGLMRAKTNNEILTLYAHRVIPDNSSDANHNFGMRVSKLNQVIATAKQMGLKFYTFAEAYQIGTHQTPAPPTNITVSVEGSRANIRWGELPAHDLVGIVPAAETEWQSHMPAASTDGSVSGKLGITVPALATDQQYRAIFYSGSVKVEASPLFTIEGTGDPTDPTVGTISTYMEGSRLRINWSGLPAHDFIGVVPANQSNWQNGMPGATTNGSASGKMGITVSNAVSGQQYVVIFYSGTTKVSTSQPLVIVGGGTDPTDPTDPVDPTGNVAVYMQGQRVRIAWDGVPTHTRIGIAPVGQSWQQGMPYADTNGAAKGKMGITYRNATTGQAYVAILYNGSTKVITSAPLVVKP